MCCNFNLCCNNNLCSLVRCKCAPTEDSSRQFSGNKGHNSIKSSLGPDQRARTVLRDINRPASVSYF